MELEIEVVIERPVATVWDFVAVRHVQNHPRWDPDLELEQISDGPLGLGTLIRRQNARYEPPTEGTMEIVEFVPEQVMGTKIQDGPIETRGRVTLTPDGTDRTTVTLWAEFPGMDEARRDEILRLVQRTARTIKQLIEGETRGA